MTFDHAQFVHYDPATGIILAFTTEHFDHYAARLAAGQNMIRLDRPIDINTHVVDLATLKVVPK